MKRINFEKLDKQIEKMGTDKFAEKYGTDQAAELRLICKKPIEKKEK